jgi:hypothetical protein
MERLEKLVNKHHEENKPLITKSVQFPIAEEVIEIPNQDYEDSSSCDEDDIESGNPRIKRIKRWLKSPCCFKCIEDDNPHKTLLKSTVIIGSFVIGIIYAVNKYYV